MRGFRIKFRSEEIVVTPDFRSSVTIFTVVRTAMNYRLPVSKALEMTPWILFG